MNRFFRRVLSTHVGLTVLVYCSFPEGFDRAPDDRFEEEAGRRRTLDVRSEPSTLRKRIVWSDEGVRYVNVNEKKTDVVVGVWIDQTG